MVFFIRNLNLFKKFKKSTLNFLTKNSHNLIKIFFLLLVYFKNLKQLFFYILYQPMLAMVKLIKTRIPLKEKKISWSLIITSWVVIILRDVLHLWVAQHFGQEGGLQRIPPDWSLLFAKNLSRAFGQRKFSLQTPDLNPMDYSVWSILEQKIFGKRYNIVEALKATLVSDFVYDSLKENFKLKIFRFIWFYK